MGLLRGRTEVRRRRRAGWQSTVLRVVEDVAGDAVRARAATLTTKHWSRQADGGRKLADGPGQSKNEASFEENTVFELAPTNGAAARVVIEPLDGDVNLYLGDGLGQF